MICKKYFPSNIDLGYQHDKVLFAFLLTVSFKVSIPSKYATNYMQYHGKMANKKYTSREFRTVSYTFFHFYTVLASSKYDNLYPKYVDGIKVSKYGGVL